MWSEVACDAAHSVPDSNKLKRPVKRPRLVKSDIVSVIKGAKSTKTDVFLLDVMFMGAMRVLLAADCNEALPHLSVSGSATMQKRRHPVDHAYSQPPRFAAEIFNITCDEQDRGFCGPFLTKAGIDAAHGAGCWRHGTVSHPTAGRQNQGHRQLPPHGTQPGHYTLHETNCGAFRCYATFGRMVCDALDLHQPPQDSEPWLRMRIGTGTDDLPDAVVSYVSAMSPQLGVAIARRCCLSFAAAYFDDEELAVEFLTESNSSQLGLRLAFTSMGATRQAAKAFRPATNRDFPMRGNIQGRRSSPSSVPLSRKPRWTETQPASFVAILTGFSSCAGQTGPVCRLGDAPCTPVVEDPGAQHVSSASHMPDTMSGLGSL
eukprot:s2986_g17.t1